MSRTTFPLAFAALLILSCGRPDGGESPHVGTTPTTATPASATTTGATAGNVTLLTAEEKEFVVQAGLSNLAEIALARIGVERAQKPVVKSFAERLVQDHTKAFDEVKVYATNKGVGLATEMNQAQQATAANLTTAAANTFDRDFVAVMVQEHQKAVTSFESAAVQAKDPDLKAWIDKTLPVLREHLEMAKAMAGQK